MEQFVYPAVFYYEDDNVTVVYPDLNIFTDGTSVEDAFLYAKDYLRVYCEYARKYEIDIESPTKFEKIVEQYPEAKVMLIDVIIKLKNNKE